MVVEFFRKTTWTDAKSAKKAVKHCHMYIFFIKECLIEEKFYAPSETLEFGKMKINETAKALL